MFRKRFLITSGLTLATAAFLAVEPAAAHFPRGCDFDEDTIANANWYRSLYMSKMWPYNVQGASADWNRVPCPAPPYMAEQDAYQATGPSPGPDVASTVFGTPAQIDVSVPADAVVWVNGKQTPTTGTLRNFVSQPLTPGFAYGCEIRASWREGGREVTQTRQMILRAGTRVSTEFLASTPTESPVTPVTGGEKAAARTTTP